MKPNDLTVEARRLLALREFNVLDSAPELALDALTRLASKICEAPIALISLVDENRQWFKAKVGLPDELTETPREIAFCSHAIQFTKTFIVEDATTDERFRDNPFVTGEAKVRFYAGAQLSTESGLNLGTLCVIDQIPRKLTPEQIESLETIAKQVMVNLEYQRLRLQAVGRENFLSGVVGNLPDFVAYIDTDLVYRYANDTYAEWFFGKKPGEVIGKKLVDLMDPSYLEFARPYMLKTLGGKKQSFEKTYPFIKRRGEVAQTILARYVPDLDGDGSIKGFYTIVTDITAQKAAEKRAVAQSERVLFTMAELKAAQHKVVTAAKLASLGEMAAGIAHEINNPLSIMMGKTELLKYQIDNGHNVQAQLAKELNAILQTGKRIAQIVSGLKTFSRSAENDSFSASSFAAIIDDTLSLYGSRLVRDQIETRVVCDKNLQAECRPA